MRTRRDPSGFGVRLAVSLALLPSVGCYVGPGGGFESVSAGATVDGADEVGDEVGGEPDFGFPPGAVECDFELGANPVGGTACIIDEDCCVAPIAAGSLLGAAACPSDEFPNNWACESGVCRQRSSPSVSEGCSADAQCSELMGSSWICAVISGVGHCVVDCSTNGVADCQSENLPGFTCETVGTYSFCMQEPP